MMTQASATETGPRIVRGKVDSLSLYEITDYELQVLEEGAPNATLLNFAIFFLSVGLSFFTALLTTPPESVRTFTVFVVLTIVGIAVGVVLLVLWRRQRSRVATLVVKIKQRCVVPDAPPPTPDRGIGPAATEGQA